MPNPLTRSLPPLLALCLFAPCAGAQEPDQPPSAEEALSRARAAFQAGDVDAALKESSSATDLDPANPEAWALRGDCHARRDNDVAEDREYAVECYARALTLVDSEPVRRSLIRAISGGAYPKWVTARALPFLPGAYETRNLPILDKRLAPDRLGDVAGAVSTAHQYPETVPKRHPRNNAIFPGVVYGYLADRGDQSERLWLSVQVYYQTEVVAARDYRAEAVLICRTALHLTACYHAYVGASGSTRLTRPLSVYLMEGPARVVEGLPRYVDVWDADAERSPAQWLIAICRGLGYAALPPIAGFAQPEPLANGAIGETLFAKWLALNSTDGMPVWDTMPVSLDEHLETACSDALQSYLGLPTTLESFADPSEAGIQATAGLFLYADAVLSAEERSALFGSAARLDQMELLMRLSNTLRDRTSRTMRVPGGLFVTKGTDVAEPFAFASAESAVCVMLPKRPVRYRVYLAEGKWKVTLGAQGPDISDRDTTFTVRLEGSALAEPMTASLALRAKSRLAVGDLPAELPHGWYLATLTHDNDEGTVDLQSLTFTRP